MVFANPENVNLVALNLEGFKNLLGLSCNPAGCFDPPLWGLPNIRSQPYDPELDHDWYEFESVEETEAPPTVASTLAEFMDKVKANPLKSLF